MDILNDLLTNHSSELVNSLSESGFSVEQAQEFLPEAGQGVKDALSAGDLVSLLGSDTNGIVTTLLEKVDTLAIAERLGLDETMVNKGLEVLIPKAMEIFKEEGGGLSALLGSGEAGLFGGISKLGSKFFK